MIPQLKGLVLIKHFYFYLWERLVYFINLNKECLLTQVTQYMPPYILPSFLPSFLWLKFKGYI